MADKIKIGSFVLVVGRMGEGKSPYIKSLIKKSNFKNVAIFDRRKEYDAKAYTVFYYFAIFKDWLLRFVRTFIVVEEATAVVGYYKDLDLADVITGVQHNNNVLVFTFHSWRDVPQSLLNKTNYLVIFATNDTPAFMRSNFEMIYPYWHEMKYNAEKHKVKGDDGKMWNVPYVVDYNTL